MKKDSLKDRTRCTVIFSLFILLLIGFSLPAWAEQCYTGCKEGPKEYSSGVTWICTYDRLGNVTGVSNVDVEDYKSSVCQLTVRGSLKNVGIDYGHHKNFKECLEELCLPKISESCGELDRCNNVKNWRK